MTLVTTVEQLEAIYGAPAEPSLVKETAHITPEYARYIEAAPFAVLATAGPGGLDCSPRGDKPGFMRIADERTLMLPDRHGNNRIDSLRNVIADPRVALLFLIPGFGGTLRVNGTARISTDAALLRSFAIDGKAPRSVLIVDVQTVYFQCARAILRSELWNPERHVDPKTLPSPGQILSAITSARIGGEAYDKAWPQKAKETLW
ncbi:pyridoxamine 5'-phosphate oxidase family protein [Pseudorhodoplanes sp.]|uniref:pyridoxamine 5'-phosphate oxidase family protein n=1 Tax=Pseudorhodoplanes sp. TaxID=1934341 RepID=UPI002B6AF891|nr:pyridoxamine 5'-phosphate oxidase family protein [Pseudorhodoplanes sp.]HWV55518.1 pyridoxamine 5'-phosphate oxidase family protein [Pseudorhodoplanes sp.]